MPDLLLPLSVPLLGMPTHTPSKKRAKVRALALDGRQSIGRYNNQPRVGVRGRIGLKEEARLGLSAWGGLVPSFGAAIRTTKK